MREIKFRAWADTHRRGMYYSNDFDHLEDFFENTAQIRIDLMQFTGLIDKNGKEIYEGDIVKFEESDHVGDVRFGKGLQGEPADWEGTFWGWTVGDDEPLVDDYQDLEVIGNIYENPELFEEQK